VDRELLLGDHAARQRLITGGYGLQKTPFFYNAETKETVAWLSSMTISGDAGDPADVVPVLRFLVAPETRWVTAQTI
jgi:hypothetical protein